jgi:hypothetical protein
MFDLCNFIQRLFYGTICLILFIVMLIHQHDNFSPEIIWNGLKVSEAVYQDKTERQKNVLRKTFPSIKSFMSSPNRKNYKGFDFIYYPSFFP